MFSIDPFERPLPFQRSENERGELTIALSPVRVGTHWIRVCNNESKNFALLPIFAFDDDYVPLSPVATPSPEDQSTKGKSSKSQHHQHQEIFFPVVMAKDLTTISETSDVPTSQISTMSSSSQLPSLNKDIGNVLSPTYTNESPVHGRRSPEVQILDITDLTDPGVRVVSKFSFKDVDNQFHITLYGKKTRHREEKLLHWFSD